MNTFLHYLNQFLLTAQRFADSTRRSFFLREAILQTAKTLVEDTKKLVTAAQATQEVLATAAQSAVGSVSRLADHVKFGAAALGSEDSDAQVRGRGGGRGEEQGGGGGGGGRRQGVYGG